MTTVVFQFAIRSLSLYIDDDNNMQYGHWDRIGVRGLGLGNTRIHTSIRWEGPVKSQRLSSNIEFNKIISLLRWY